MAYRGGSDDNDTLTGTAEDDVIEGRGGNDTLNGLEGKDKLYGGVGDDTLHGGWGEDRLYGDEDDDTLHGGRGDDRLYGGYGPSMRDRPDGADILDGGAGDDRLYGGRGEDTLYGGEDDDILVGQGGEDRLYGGAGDDLLHGDGDSFFFDGDSSDGADILDGGPGDDTLHGGDWDDLYVFGADSGHDTIRGFEPGVDKIQFSEPDITFADLRIESNGGNARVSWGGGRQSITLIGIAATTLTEGSFLFSDDATQPDADTLTGTAADNSLTGTADAETIDGLGGNDELVGLAGDDTLYGGVGDDTLHGGFGADMLYGGPGADTASYLDSDEGVLVRLHDARAVRFGHAEGDTLTGIEHLIGSRHNDTLAGDGGDNRLEGRDGNDVLYGGPTGGDDLMYGGNGDDRLFGGRGDDTLTGGAGFDYLKGGPGDDELVAGEGMDILYGGNGRDTFVFSPSNVGGAVIVDFSNGEDRIDLTAFAGIDSMDDLDRVSHGDNVRIEVSGADYLTTIILSGFDINNLDNSDFLF